LEDIRFINIRLNKEVHDKFRYASEYEGRSMSKQTIYLINKYVREFEVENGKIEIERDDK